jgi:hypothetical protein
MVERTVAGTQYGTVLTYQTSTRWSFGGFYQTTLKQMGDGIQRTDPFYGVVAKAPIARSERMTFLLNGRCGMVNNNFLVIVPAVETEVNISRSFRFSALAGIRMRQPSLAVSLSVKL